MQRISKSCKMSNLKDFENNIEDFDLIVVGAGVNGLYAAKTFLAIQPSINLVIVDSLTSFGGVWAKERIYPGLNLQVPHRYFEFPELSYDELEPPAEVNQKGFVTGNTVSRYFEQWAVNEGLFKYTRFNTTVNQIRRVGEGWICEIAGNSQKLTTKKLIIATGISSVPSYPAIDYHQFAGPVIHQRHFGELQELWDRGDIGTVVVYGSGKGGLDSVMQLVRAGKKVKWIIRKEGGGPCWVFNGKIAENFYVRILGILLPSIYQKDGFGTLHFLFKRTFIGRSIIKMIINLSRYLPLNDMKPLNDNIRKLIPDLAPFWLHPIANIDNYDDNIWDPFRDGTVEVIRDSVAFMRGEIITLASGDTLTADAAIFATGFKTRMPFFTEDPELEMKLGLPCPLDTYSNEYLAKWKALEVEADEKVFTLNPLLREAPSAPVATPNFGPFRLYHWTVPTEFADRSIAILGAHTITGTLHSAMVKSLWIAAYMNGKLDLPNKTDMEKITAYEQRSLEITYLGQGNGFPMSVCDWTSVLSMLLKELGFSGRLKETWFGEIFEGVTCKDLEIIIKKGTPGNRL